MRKIAYLDNGTKNKKVIEYDLWLSIILIGQEVEDNMPYLIG